MPTTRLIPLRPLPSLSTGQTVQTGRAAPGGRGPNDGINPVEMYGVFPWDDTQDQLLNGGGSSGSEQKESFSAPSRKPTPDQEFYSLASLFSPLRDGFSVIEIASDMGISAPGHRSYMTTPSEQKGVATYETNTQIVQGMARSTGLSFDCVL